MAGNKRENAAKKRGCDVKRLIAQRDTSKQRPPDSQSTMSL
jgi:hypothetical protein